MKTAVTWLLIACLVPCLTGCEHLKDDTLTGRLWASDTTGPAHYRPATPSNLKLFEDTQHGDILVEYDELSEKTGKIKRRAYLLDANQDRILAARKPRFVDPHAADNLTSIPVESNSADTTDFQKAVPIRAALSPDGLQFTLISVGQSVGPHRLPVYAGSADHFDRFMFTPMTVTGDAVIHGAIVGAVAGVVCLYALAESGTTIK